MAAFSEPEHRLEHLRQALAADPAKGTLGVNTAAWRDHPLTQALLCLAKANRDAAVTKWIAGRATPELQGEAAAYDAILHALSDTRILERQICNLLKGR